MIRLTFILLIFLSLPAFSQEKYVLKPEYNLILEDAVLKGPAFKMEFKLVRIPKIDSTGAQIYYSLVSEKPVSIEQYLVFLNEKELAIPDAFIPTGVAKSSGSFEINDADPDSPVRDISPEAADAFAMWLSDKTNEYLAYMGMPPIPRFRIPSAEENLIKLDGKTRYDVKRSRSRGRRGELIGVMPSLVSYETYELPVLSYTFDLGSLTASWYLLKDFQLEGIADTTSAVDAGFFISFSLIRMTPYEAY